jgi:hypothetical protein
MFTALGATAYVAFRIDSALFYGRLGANPEEVGIRYPTVLAQVAVAAVVAGFFAFLIVNLLDRAEGLYRRMGGRWKLWEAALLVAIVVLGGTAALLVDHRNLWADVGLTLIGTTIYFLPIGLLLPIYAARLRVRWMFPGAWPAALTVLGGLLSLGVMAFIYGGQVRDGQIAVGARRVLLPWSARVAEVRWKSRRPPIQTDACVLYLGQTQSGALLYTAGRRGVRRLLIVSASDGLVSVLPEAQGCRGWGPPR